MKEKVIKEIEQKMASILNNEQKEKLKDVAFPSTLENLKLATATLGNDAGILGAAYLGIM